MQKRVQDPLISSTQETECLPEEDVSITEDISHDDQIENMKALINGNSRRKLYFNPAYFEPHLLAVSIFLSTDLDYKCKSRLNFIHSRLLRPLLNS